ncbi:MAG: 30S ribosomal protein S1 [Spirochaetes bacterium]|nr:MAG: 30S ribosomal protein S1 [Spirochaetota bacterium]
MAEFIPEAGDEFDQERLQEEYLKNLEQIEEGQLIEGEVVEINSEHVFVDVGYKSEGKIPLSEFEKIPEIGDPVNVVLISKEGKEGEIVVSKRKADIKLFWKNLREAYHEKRAVEGTFIRNIKGGFEVDIGYGVKGFNPLSRADTEKLTNPKRLLGVTSKFLIERLYSNNKIKIILSRRDWLEREIERKREEFFKNVKIGDDVEGTVKSFTSFGAFIDLGGFDGLLHINDMSWGHVTRPKDYVKKGQTIKLKVIRQDPYEKKINLSLKHFTPDPWTSFEDKYSIDDIVKGRVTKLTDFGAFIELEEGIEGLAHISEFSWVKRIKHPKEVLKVGDEVEVKILSYDIQKGRVSLGLKQVYPNPWETMDERYPKGMRLKRRVRKITNSGAFVELEEGIDGFVYIDDLSWTKKYKHPSAVLKENEEREFVILNIDKENRKIRLGVKQLSEDPWISLSKAYRKGSIIEGEVTSITDFGIFIRVQGEIEGLVHKNNITTQPNLDLEEIKNDYNVGDKVKAVIVELNPSKHKLLLSIKDYQKRTQEEELLKYIHDETEETTVKLGDLIGDKGNS